MVTLSTNGFFTASFLNGAHRCRTRTAHEHKDEALVNDDLQCHNAQEYIVVRERLKVESFRKKTHIVEVGLSRSRTRRLGLEFRVDFILAQLKPRVGVTKGDP
jgi:hypothetical protein